MQTGNSFALRGLQVSFAGETHIGRKRQINEDSLYVPGDLALAIVADGMGGHSSGEVASRMAVDTMIGYFDETRDEAEQTWPYKMDADERVEVNRLVVAIKLANLRIWQAAQKTERRHGMGTTVVAAYFADDQVFIGHVGDSRAYRLRNGKLEQLTQDHSLLNDYLRMKKLRPEEVTNFQHKNVIVRALGMKEQVQVELTHDRPHPGDVYVLCSDGLTGMVQDDQMLELLAGRSDLSTACRNLVDMANTNGGVDNITVVVAQLT